jgi:Tol biopolymer transport system component
MLAAKLNCSNKADLIEVIGTDGKSGGHLGLGELNNVQQVRVSPDGKRLAFVRFVPMNGPKGKPQYAYPVNEVFVADVKSGKVDKVSTAKELADGLFNGRVAWAPDGKRVAVLWVAAGAGR